MKIVLKNFSTNLGIIIPIIVVLFNIFLILNPSEMILASKDGLLLWFNQVLPTLLPFVVGANMLAGLGFIHFMGNLMAPVMIPLFRVPGAGAFALLTGLSSGYPLGAKAVAHLRETGQVKKHEAQRLMTFCNNAGPLFVVGFVGVGLLGSARLGYLLLLSHVLAALFIGILYRILFPIEMPQKSSSGLRQAFRAYRNFRQNQYEGFGQVMGASVKNAMESMVLVGGFIIVFCVLIKALEVAGLFVGLSYMQSGFAAGLLEVANGAKMLSQGEPPNQMALVVIAAVISFGGFSVHAQTAHFIRNTDIEFAPYLLAKVLQALVAGGICWLLVG